MVVSDFKLSRSEMTVFSVLLLPEPLETWIAPSVPLDFPLDFPLFSLPFPLPVIEDSLLDHDLP